jgi:DNA-binding response OmpR family regulator
MVQVLVAEDVGAISLALEDALTDAGYAVAGPFASCATALEWLDGNRPDLALLDAVLSDGLCIELARALRARTVPFLVLSGNHPLYGFPKDLHDALWIEKPVTYEQLVNGLTMLTGKSSPD